MASIYEQVKTAQVNSFTGGMNTDLHPMVQPSDTMTDCLNGTLITYQGNENIIQNDMGNYELKNAKLPEGYIPLGMKEHNGIIYIVSTNPITGKTQIGSYPSPQTLVEDGDPIERSIKEIEIPYIKDKEGNIIGIKDEKENYTNIDLFEYLETNGYNALTNKAESIIFSDLFDDMTQITNNDRYELVNSSYNDETDDSKFQYDQFFILDSDNKITNIDSPKIEDNFNGDSENIKTNVSWDIPGWLGFKHKLYTPKKHVQNISGSILKTVSLTNYSVIDNKLQYNGDNYLIGIRANSGYTLDFAEVCKLVQDNELWLELKDTGKINSANNYYVSSHDYLNGDGIITFESPLYVQPNLFLSNIKNIDLPHTIKKFDLNRIHLEDVETLIVSSNITNICIRQNQNLKIIIRGQLNHDVEISYISNGATEWDSTKVVHIECSNYNNIKIKEGCTINLIQDDWSGNYENDRTDNSIRYNSSNKAIICKGVIKDRYFYRIQYENTITDINNIFTLDNIPTAVSDIQTIIFPSTVISGLRFFEFWDDNIPNINIYYSSQNAGKYYDGDLKKNIRYYDYYTHCHYIKAEIDKEEPIIEAFDTFITSEIEGLQKGLNSFIPITENIRMEVWLLNDPEYYFHIYVGDNINNFNKVDRLKIKFKQYYITDGILYSIIDIDNNYQLSIDLYKSGNDIYVKIPDLVDKKTTGNSFAISNVLYKCPIKNLNLGIFYKIIGSNSTEFFTKYIEINTNNEDITTSISIDSGDLKGIDPTTEYILIESVPYYLYKNKILILDNLKEQDKIQLINPNHLDLNVRKFQYKVSKEDSSIKVNLELDKVVDTSEYVAKLYQFKNGKLLENVANRCILDSNWTDNFSCQFILNKDSLNIPFFIFSIEGLYKGIVVNTDKVNKEDHKLQYNDYNLIPDLITINPTQNDSINVSNPRVVYMYIPEGVVEEVDNEYSIKSDQCSKITYYNKPWILSKDEVLKVHYLGVGVIGDITINNELLLDNNVTAKIPYNIYNNNLTKLTDSNTYTILCSYQIFPYKMNDNNSTENKYSNYLTREYLLRSTYSPFTLMKEKIDKDDPNDTGLNYKLTPELINYAEWGATKYENASKIINIEKQPGKNVGTHIEAVTNYEGLVDNIKGDIYTTNFRNLLSQLKKKQLFYFFNCQVKTKDNGLVIPFPLMKRDGMDKYYWSDVINGIHYLDKNGLAALTATRKSEWLPSSSFMKKFKNRGLSNVERILATVGASAAVGTLASVAITFSILNGIPAVGPIIATVVAVIGLIFFLGRMKLKDRYWIFLGLRFEGKDKATDKAPFIIPMWGSRKKSRAYMITNSGDLERAEQRLMTFCKNVYYLSSEPFGNDMRIIIPTIEDKYSIVNNYNINECENSSEYKTGSFNKEISLESREVFNTQYEGVYLSELPQLLSDLIGHTNNNVSVNSNNKLEIEIKITNTDLIEKLIKPTVTTDTTVFGNLKNCLEIQFSDYVEENTKSSQLSKFKLDTDQINDYPVVCESINSVLDNLTVDRDTGQWYFKYLDDSSDYEDNDFNMLSVQGNRGRKWRTLWTWINGKKKQVHAGEEVTSEDGYAPIARPCNPKDEEYDTFMVPNNWNNEDSNSWKDWKDASQLEVPEYLTFLSTVYGTKEL